MTKKIIPWLGDDDWKHPRRRFRRKPTQPTPPILRTGETPATSFLITSPGSTYDIVVPASSGLVWYSVTLGSPGEIKADTYSTIPSETDTVISLYRSDETLIRDNDEAPVGWLSLIYEQVPAGTYFIAVGLYSGAHDDRIRLSVTSSVYPLSRVIKPTTESIGAVDHNYLLSSSPYGTDKMLKSQLVYDETTEEDIICLVPTFEGPYSFGTYTVRYVFFVSNPSQSLSFGVVAINGLTEIRLNGVVVHPSFNSRRETILIESGLVMGLNTLHFVITVNDIFGFKII